MKILYVTTIGGTMSFFPEHFKMLLREGHSIELACNTNSPVREHVLNLGLKVHHIPFSRNPFVKDNFTAYQMLKELVANGQYALVHCHTPNAAAITRLACIGERKRGLKVFYTAHGFHFYKSAPIKNWLIYYPIEKICSYWTDVLITINKEDYALACRKMKAKKNVYIPGVGIELDKFVAVDQDRKEKRKELGIPLDAIIILSVGEINENKNHQVIVRAISQIKNDSLHYVIAGQGAAYGKIKQLADKLGLSDRVHLLGFRKDVRELYQMADIFAFPSYREGLGLAALEAMACGLPLITSNVHGINDYSEDEITGYKSSPGDVNGFVGAIEKLVANPQKREEMGRRNMLRVQEYASSKVISIMQDVYENL